MHNLLYMRSPLELVPSMCGLCVLLLRGFVAHHSTGSQNVLNYNGAV